MPGACIPFVIDGAKQRLDQWINDNRCLCDLKRATFPDFPYGEAHCQALYQLRYFPAYFAENYLMFQALDACGLVGPQITSLGCGCLVDIAAALDVFHAIDHYDGYDIINWANKAINPSDHIVFHQQDIFTVESFSPGTNVFLFSRSIGDLGARIDELANAIADSEFESDRLYICATYQIGDDGIVPLRAYLSQFANLFVGYARDGAGTLFNPASDGTENYGFARGRLWLRHPDANYLTGLADRCNERPADCEPQRCPVSRQPIFKVHHLAYEILPLVREELL